MSNPPNKLASFRSYSYYHVLVMCDSSQTADTLASSSDLNIWEHATPNTKVSDSRPLTHDLGPYSPKQADGAGKYIVLINGSTDASFVIQTANWTSATGASAVPGDRSTSIAVEGSLKISEPKGIAFLDQVVKCCVALRVDSAQVVYVLKTFFIGFRDDDQAVDGGGNRLDFIGDIPPVNFIVYDVTGSFTEAGGTYEMMFVAAGHGATRLPQYSKAVNSMSLTAGDSLKATLTNLETNINTSYEQYFSCVYSQVEAVAGDSSDLLKSLRRVKYVIEVGRDYSGANELKYKVSNQSQQYKNTAGCNDAAQITFPAHTSIETAINTIMTMSPQVQADMAKGDTSTSIKYEYKIHTALVSQRASDAKDGEIEYTVYYRVERFMAPKTISYNSSFEDLQTVENDQDPKVAQLRQNIIEFDYMYTGKNIDILEFDMKVNMGMAYLQTATLANTFKSQLERAANRQMQPSAADLNNHAVRFGSIVPTPVFFGSQIKSPNLINSQNAGDAIQTAYTLTKHASLEVLDVSMKIIGSTQLLGTTNRTTSSKYIVETATRVQEFEEQREGNFADWSHSPAYVKIKIKMPRENDDFALFTGQSSTGDPRTDPGITDYARDFWFDGFYYVVGIEHTFDGGEFTQVLQLLGLPKRSAFQASQDNATAETAITTGVGLCYDNQIGANSSTPPPTVPVTPPAGNTEPTTRADANSANATGKNPSDVVGWDKASPAVKNAIIEASNRYGVDVVVMAQFAAKESNFNPNAKAPTSSATGLYQFINSTWTGLVNQGKIAGLPPGSPDQRLNPQFNAAGGAVFLRDNAKAIGSEETGDLYLAHFLGPGRAAKVISSDRRSGGQELLVTALGVKATLKIATANPSIIKPNTTVGELRTWAATSMAKTLKGGIKVANQRKATPPAAAANAPGQTLPSSNPQDARRTADKQLAAVQNEAVQKGKTDTNPCGPTAGSAPQDKPTREGQ